MEYNSPDWRAKVEKIKNAEPLPADKIIDFITPQMISVTTMEKFKPLRIADIMARIRGEEPTEKEALINSLSDEGKIAAVNLIVNKDSRDTAKKVFLSTLEEVTVEKVMNSINQRTRNK